MRLLFVCMCSLVLSACCSYSTIREWKPREYAECGLQWAATGFFLYQMTKKQSADVPDNGACRDKFATSADQCDARQIFAGRFCICR